MAEFLISTDISTDIAYKHLGFSATTTDSYNYGAGVTADAAWDGKYLYVSYDTTVKKIDPTASWSSPVVLQTLTFGSNISGISWDGENLLVLFSNDVFQQMLGFSTIVQAQWTFAAEPTLYGGIVFYEGNLYTSTWEPLGSPVTVVRKHSGLSATVASSVTLPSTENPAGIAFDSSGNLLVSRDLTGGAGVDTIQRYVGFSSTADTSVASPSSQVRGIAWGFEIIPDAVPTEEGSDSTEVEEAISAAKPKYVGLTLPHTVKPGMNNEALLRAIQQNNDALVGWSKQFQSED